MRSAGRIAAERCVCKRWMPCMGIGAVNAAAQPANAATIAVFVIIVQLLALRRLEMSCM